MPSIPCPGGVSGYWKTKSEALKWMKKVNDWPCSPVSKCQGALGCERTGLFFKTKLRDGKTVWYAMVECICPPPGIPTEEESITSGRTFQRLLKPSRSRRRRLANNRRTEGHRRAEELGAAEAGLAGTLHCAAAESSEPGARAPGCLWESNRAATALATFIIFPTPD